MQDKNKQISDNSRFLYSVVKIKRNNEYISDEYDEDLCIKSYIAFYFFIEKINKLIPIYQIKEQTSIVKIDLCKPE